VIQHLSMAYQSRHFSTTLLYSASIIVSLLASFLAFRSYDLSLHVHLKFLFFSQICMFFPHLFCTSTPRHHASTCMHHTQLQQPSPLCSAFLYSLCTFCMPHAQCLCMLLQSLFFPNGLFTIALPHTHIAPQQKYFIHS
jgi:hypothetical protein